MKNQIKLTITLGIILTCFLFSCKKQDGYSDEVYTNPNSGNATAETANDSTTTNDSVSTNNGAAGQSGQPAGAQSTGYQSASSGDVNAGGGGSGSITGAQSATSGKTETKGTGAGSGPAHSAKDGASYTPYSDPKQNPNKDTIKKSNKRKN